LVSNWNPTQFRLDNGYNINEEIIFEQKLDKRDSVVDRKFLLKRDTFLFMESIYSNRLFKLKLLYWNSEFTRETLLMIMQFIWKRQLIQKNSFVLEKDWNYILLDWKAYNYKLDGILNKSENRTNGFTIKEYCLLISQFKFLLFLMILEKVINLQILYIIIISGPSYIHILSKVIEY
jgi:hypothetical protein